MVLVSIARACRVGGAYAFTALILVGCGKPAPVPQARLPKVSTLTLDPRPLTVFEELPGRVVPVRIAEIRAQVNGIVQRRLFEQGAEVRQGQPLFQINAAPFKADADAAAAALARARAAHARAQAQAERLAPLMQADAISRQEYDDAVAHRDQAAADVEQAQAALARRRLDLRFATVDAPISGRIDQALVSEGALVAPGDATPLARIQQISQVYVDVRQPEARYAALRAASDGLSGLDLPVAILRSGGAPYGRAGRLLFSGSAVDTGTGDVLLRILVDNHQAELLPGMFVQARIPFERHRAALMAPQQSIVRLSGKPHLWIVDKHGVVRLTSVTLGALVEQRYHVTAGVAAGQKIVVEGMERLSAGATVDAMVWKDPALAMNARSLR
ncbi:efflux RND transporter periplasmic adaptor subunit [uncultured Massilia sp.]|uniref:efflux RND transporter periplasmic adaptor subunit n=1 Tax=uncultured Massilia sp. TaxID=169973 RepID=UPI0035A3C9A7